MGGQIDEQKLKSIGDAGVSAMICDSTNILVQESWFRSSKK